MVELPRLPLAVVLPAAGLGLPAGCVAVPPDVLIRSARSISGSQHDFELIELVPLGVGPLPLWNRQKSLQASTGGNRLRFIHGGIISSFDIVSETGSDLHRAPMPSSR